MDLVVADAVGVGPLPVAGDPVAHLPKPSQELDVNVDQFAWPLPPTRNAALEPWAPVSLVAPAPDG